MTFDEGLELAPPQAAKPAPRRSAAATASPASLASPGDVALAGAVAAGAAGAAEAPPAAAQVKRQRRAKALANQAVAAPALSTEPPAVAPVVAPVVATAVAMAAAPTVAASASPVAVDLYAQVLGASTLDAAAHRLVATLALTLGFSRVSFGLRDQGRTRLLACSSGDISNRQADLPERLLGAMDEALDQAVPLAWPSAQPRVAGVADAICLEQAALQTLCGGVLASVPLGQGGELFGAVCVQRDQGPPLADGELQQLVHWLGLAAPALRWMMQAQLPWHRRTLRDLQLGWAAWRQPDRRVGRRLLAGAVAALALLALLPLQHEVGGRARIEGAEQRLLVAPVDGFIKTAHVRPGDRVAAGAPLLDMLEQDLRLERERWSSQLAQHENAYAAAMARADRVTAATSMARVREAQSQLALIDGQIERGRLTAPFDALVTQGDFSQSIGAPVRQGDVLITLASTGQYRVIVDVDESDIAKVQPGQSGRLALSSLPWGGQDLRVERIAPMAKAVEGRNVFEVEARLPTPSDELRPGLLGRAQLVVGRQPPLWVWLQQAANRLRLAYWSWLG